VSNLEPAELTYERAVELFDERLRTLEEGELTLDEAISTVDEASRLLRTAERKLDEARARIEVRPPAEPEGIAPGSEANRPPNGPPSPDDEGPIPEELPF
jgi:exodeoxyribonuclease VII small subunit